MISKDKLMDTVGQEARTQEGEKLGTVGAIFFDDYSGRPEFATVQTGLFGKRETFVPIRDAQLGDKGLELPYDKETLKNAPNADPEEHITPDQERELFEYYRLPYRVKPGSEDWVTGADTDAHSAAERAVVEADPLTGQVRLRRYVVT